MTTMTHNRDRSTSNDETSINNNDILTPSAYYSQDTYLSEIVSAILSYNTPIVTYDQIEAVIASFGLNSFEEDDLYKSIIDSLEKQNIIIVETLEQDQEWIDENIAINDLANEVWEVLKQSKSAIDEYKHPLLSADRERRLIEIYHVGKIAERGITSEMNLRQRISTEKQIEAGKQALDEIMRCNLRLVTKIAFRFKRRISHLTFDDLIQEGRIGLYKAIDRFDLSSKLRLSTYATWWIRQAIERAIADSDRIIRLPVHVQETLHRINRERQRFLAEIGREPHLEELSNCLKIPEKNLVLFLRIEQDASSLDIPVRSGEETTIGDLIPDVMQYEPSRLVHQNIMKETIKTALKLLTEREFHIISLRFGLENGIKLTLEEIGQDYGLTRERIRQIEAKALRKLKSPSIAKKLQDFLD